MHEETIKDIRKRCRMAMNGIASTSMRQQGLNYKLNFGVSLQKIKEIASRYDANKELAETLWVENTRELKILACLLYPIESFSKEVATRWLKEISNQEIREQVCLIVFQNLPFASDLVASWTVSDNEDVRTTGYWLLARLLITKQFTGSADLLSYPSIIEDSSKEDVSLRNAAILALKHIGRASKDSADRILIAVKQFEKSANPIEKESYDSLKFEFEFYFD